jgi:V8-like Glu-specific endopeptidase
VTQGWTWTDVLMTDIHAVSGMSGGPVFNNDDEVVGIVVATAGTIVLIVDNKTIQEFLNEKND